MDEEGDEIIIGSEEELKEAFKVWYGWNIMIKHRLSQNFARFGTQPFANAP